MAAICADEITVNLIEDTGVRPLPRRDHSALMIKSNQYMLIYGGKNDSSFQYRAADLPKGEDPIDNQRIINQTMYDSVNNSTLDDIMLFNMETL